MDTSKIQPPEMEATPRKCLPCDMMVTLGLISSTCKELPQNEQDKCYQLMKPLEEKKAAPADVLAEVIILTGDKNINETLDRMNLILYEATAKAKEKLIAQGKLDSSGFPIELK